MRSDQATEFLTIREAAALLRVSPVTVKRWLKQARLPAYHVGPRAVRIRRSDLSKVVTPPLEKEVSPMKDTVPGHSQVPILPLTDEQVAQALEILTQAQTLTAQMLARRRGQPLPSSAELIRQARAERSAHL